MYFDRRTKNDVNFRQIKSSLTLLRGHKIELKLFAIDLSCFIENVMFVFDLGVQ